MNVPQAIPIISTATVQDAETIHALAAGARIDAWSVKDYRAEIERKDSFVLVARLTTAEIVGFLVARLVPGRNARPDTDLYNIAVKEKYRRAGVGEELLKTLVSIIRSKDAENIWLEVRASNRGAIRFYEKHGFRAELTRRNFYSNPAEDALIMRYRTA